MRCHCAVVCLAFLAATPVLFAATADAPSAARWRRYLDAPQDYAAFARRVEKTGAYDYPDFRVECYTQANGPDSTQRVMMAIPKKGCGKWPAVVAPFYFPEAMLGFNPVDGSSRCGLVKSGTNLTFYAEIAYMTDLVRRGYVTISADAYNLTYATNAAPQDAWAKWNHVGRELARRHPGWTGMGKLVFDTRLLLDLLEADARVDAARIGIIGHSLGGKMAFYAGCLDARVKVIVASDFGIGWDQTNWKDCWYWGEKLAEVRQCGMDNSELLTLSGAKPFCLIAGQFDTAESWTTMQKAKGYETNPERRRFVYHASGHRPPVWASEVGYRFLDEYLRPARGR